MKFRDHKYTWEKGYSDRRRHQWSLRGPKGGIHFHVSTSGAHEDDAPCGLEFHHAEDPSGGHEAPTQTQCWLIGGRCWHDGTSLYASETIWPIVRSMMPDHDAIFGVLEGEYRRHFERVEDDQ